jgi:hypothetical protein
MEAPAAAAQVAVWPTTRPEVTSEAGGQGELTEGRLRNDRVFLCLPSQVWFNACNFYTAKLCQSAFLRFCLH